MSLVSFRDWLQAKESSAFTRWRHDAAFGLKPGLPGSVHSRSTASPFETEKLSKKCKKKKNKPLKESKQKSVKDKQIGNFLDAVGGLKQDAEALKDVEKKAKKSPKRKKNCIPKNR